MASKSKRRAWTLDQGLAAQYAAQAGLDPDRAAAAGEAAWDVLKSLRDTADETNPARRAKLARRVRRMLKQGGLGRYPELRKDVQVRLQEIVSKTGPNINPETGLQEFANRDGLNAMQKKSRNRLTKELDAALNLNLPQPKLNHQIANPKPQHTKEYWNDKLLHDQGGRVAMGQRAIDAASQFRGGSLEDLRAAEAIANAVSHKYTPTGITAIDTPSTPEEVRDLYLSQGINPHNYEDAPLTSMGDIEGVALAKTPTARIQDPFLAKKMIVTDPNHSPFIFIDENGNIRNRTDTAETNDPLYPVYRSVNDWYENDSDNSAHKVVKKPDQFLTRGGGFRF